MLAVYEKKPCMQKWLCEHIVIEMTSVSILHMRISIPSDAECRSQLLHDGFWFGDIDGLSYDC